MVNAHVDYSFYVVVVKGVEDRLALLAILDKTRIFEHAELMRYSRHAHRELFGDVAYAHFALKEEIKNLYAGTVSNYGEELCKLKEMLVIRQFYAVDYLVMRLVRYTKRNSCLFC